jgi:hypothetical protein
MKKITIFILKNITLISFLTFPLSAFAMGDLFRPSYNPYPVGVREDCSYKFQNSGGPAPLFTQFDVSCVKSLKSTPVVIDANCNYDDYQQSQDYKNLEIRKSTEESYNKLNKELGTLLKLVQVKIPELRTRFSKAYDNPTGQLEYEVLIGKYCQRGLPQTASQAFAMNIDVPASAISLWNEEYISSRWNQELKRLIQTYPGTDFPSLVELNIQGAQIWEKMLLCSGGDPELARYQYFTTEFNCANGSELKSEIQHYVLSVRFYFTTSFIKPLDFENTIKYKYQLIDALMGGRTEIQLNYESFPTFHPLFTQAINQILVELYPLGSKDSVNSQYFLDKLGLTDQSKATPFAQAVLQMDSIMPDGLYPQGLWPSANTAINFHLMAIRLGFLQEKISEITVNVYKAISFGPFLKLPDFYLSNRARLADEIRGMNKRYGL